jgi:hypothetical protein
MTPWLIVVVVGTLVVVWTADHITRIFFEKFFQRYDDKFSFQASNPDLRRTEIARLARIRRKLFVTCVLLFLLCISTMFFLKGTGTHFLWIVFVVELIALQDVQTKLRLLKFAEHVHTKDSPLPDSHRRV